MTSASESGLVAGMFQSWSEWIKEIKVGVEMEEKLNKKASQMGDFNKRNKKSATKTSERAAALIDTSIVVYCFCMWKREWKVEFMREYGKSKNDKRKKELVGVQGLFKDFDNN